MNEWMNEWVNDWMNEWMNRAKNSTYRVSGVTLCVRLYIYLAAQLGNDLCIYSLILDDSVYSAKMWFSSVEMASLINMRSSIFSLKQFRVN